MRVEYLKIFNSNRRRKKYYNRKLRLVKRKMKKSKKIVLREKTGRIYSLIQGKEKGYNLVTNLKRM